MEIAEMTIADIESRIAELDAEVRDTSDINVVDKAIEEKKALIERKAELDAIEERKKVAEAISNNEIKAEIVEERKEEKKMDIKELRNSVEYVNAYAEYVKTGKTEELRSLLTTNVENGTIAVPDFVYDVVKTAWDNSEIMSLVEVAEIKGNLKVQFEISGTDAVIHTEGGDAVAEETLTEGIATLVPAYIKKWIAISDEVMSLRGQAFLDYIYRELTYKITKKAEDQLIALIVALPSVATSTTPSANKVTSAPAMGTVAMGIANLSDEASAPVVVMNKLTWAEFKAVQYANGYGVDPFEGLKVVFNNTLPAYASASANDVYMIVGDFKAGAIANFPNGQGIEFKFDDLSKKKEDLVEVLGKEYVALGVVTCKAFTLIAKPVSA